MHEIELMQDLNHVNIVRYLGSERKEDSLNIFMEFVSGGSIASMLQKFSSFPEKVVVSFTKQILEGLRYLHERRIIHRKFFPLLLQNTRICFNLYLFLGDLKGGNILLTPEGIVKLADFGASKKLQDIRTFTDNHAAGLFSSVSFLYFLPCSFFFNRNHDWNSVLDGSRGNSWKHELWKKSRSLVSWNLCNRGKKEKLVVRRNDVVF